MDSDLVLVLILVPEQNGQPFPSRLVGQGVLLRVGGDNVLVTKDPLNLQEDAVSTLEVQSLPQVVMTSWTIIRHVDKIFVLERIE